ncbi:MAG: S41 family peptidase, partial [bacterium]|nr:S41 family peptidase [bacterium]
RTLDPHSYFLDPVSLRSMNEDQKGNYYGIGTRITKYEEKFTVIAPMKDTPAYKMGILAGDVIIAIDGKDTKDMTLDEAMSKLRGAKDTYVAIEVMRAGIDTPIPFRIQRQEIPLESISYAIVHPGDRRIGYISIRTFGGTTAKEFGDKLEELSRDDKISALIIDLRGNAGGSLYAAIDIADFFLPSGTVIVSIKGRQMKQNFIARKDAQYENLPVAVLINRGSASASEIVASALQDHKKAVIVGTRSWGKGLVQTVHKLPLSSSLALTTAKYYTPTDKCIQRDYSKRDDYLSVLYYRGYDKDNSIKGGVIPDIYVKGDVYPRLLVKLISGGLFFQFSRELIDNGSEIDENFQVDDTVIKKFKKFLKTNKVEYDAAGFKKHMKNIRYEIERDVLSNKFSAEKGLEVFLKSDPITGKAVEQLTLKLAKKKGETNGKKQTEEQR